MKPSDPVSGLAGVGPGRSRYLSNLGVETIGGLLYHFPRRYEDRRRVTAIAALAPGTPAAVKGVMQNFSARMARNRNLHIATFDVWDDSGGIGIVLFGGSRSFSHIRDGLAVFLYGTPSLSENNCLEFISPEYAVCGSEDFRPPWLRLWPIYPTTRGLPLSWLAGKIYSCVTSPDLTVEDPLPQKIIEKYSFPSIKEAFIGIHAPRTLEETERARVRLAYQEFFEHQKIASARARERELVPAKRMAAGAEFESRFVKNLPFKLTESQENAVSEIALDMDGTVPMHRLVIGDVGSGKTAVAAAAAARCVGAGHQAAILVPTTILAGQFFAFCERYLASLGARAAKISGGMKQSERDELLWKLRDGETDVLVGTHAMLGEGVAFKSLGLLVIDEQQRFGVT
ncbi:MAG: DEAD/DEAH box helicase, partial [Synergistaceae bacterium]|nr:DEAD/DEAH box helicase [Synergistaceae bacterium]